MANVKISALPAATSITGSEQIPLVQGGVTKQIAASAMGNLVEVDLSTATGTLSLTNGGTGQTTANAALNALLPAQGGHANEVLTTNGTNTSWAGGGSVIAGSFTGTLTGFTMPLSGTVNYLIFNSAFVTLYIANNSFADVSNSSNSPNMHLTGLPVAVRPANIRAGNCHVIDDSNVEPGLGFVDSSGDIEFYVARHDAAISPVGEAVLYVGSDFTNPGTNNGLQNGWSISYPL